MSKFTYQKEGTMKTTTQRILISSCFFLFSLALPFSNKVVSTQALTNGINPHRGGETAFHVVAPSDSDISMASETVTFDFTHPVVSPFEPMGGFPTQLTNTFQVANAGASKTVAIGLPMLYSFQSFAIKDIHIEKGEEEIPYEVYYGKRLCIGSDPTNPEYVDPGILDTHNLEQVLDVMLTQDSYIEDTVMLKTYVFDLSQISEDYGKVTFKINPDSTNVLLDPGTVCMDFETVDSNLQYFELRKDNELSDSNRTLSFSTLGGDLTDLKAYGGTYNAQNFQEYSVAEVMNQSTPSLNDKIHDLTTVFLTDYETHEKTVDGEKITEAFPLDPLMAERLLQYEVSLGLPLNFFYAFGKFDQLMAQAWSDYRLVLVVFDADLAPGNVNPFTLSYPFFAQIDTSLDPDVNTLTYDILPAKQWGSSFPLTITVIPPTDYFVIDPSIEFEKQENGSYVAQINEIPNDFLTLSVCESSNPDYPLRKFFEKFIEILIWSAGAIQILGAGIALAIVFGVRAKRKRQREAKANSLK